MLVADRLRCGERRRATVVEAEIDGQREAQPHPGRALAAVLAMEGRGGASCCREPAEAGDRLPQIEGTQRRVLVVVVAPGELGVVVLEAQCEGAGGEQPG